MGLMMEWATRLREVCGLSVLFDDEHWKEQEYIRGDGRPLLSFSSEHILVPMGRSQGVLHKTPTPKFKIVESKITSPLAIYRICHTARWSERNGNYDIKYDGIEYDILQAATLLEWENLDRPWKEDFERLIDEKYAYLF